jgi:lipopolysaccharide/colanic/teichoic acid biosynthesis glycosyltransferase
MSADMMRITPERSRGSALARGTKRAADVLAAAILLAAALPVLAVAALAIVLEDGTPVLFVQDRTGRAGRRFKVVKLRSMKVNRIDPEALGQIRPEHDLVLRSGGLFRRLKIDELPQLWNVLVGDMSLVGPRPTLPVQTERYDAFQARRLEVRPGASGWAQVNGGAELSWQDRILLDVWYIDHWSLWLDLRILLATARVVLLGERKNPGAVEEARQHALRIGWSGASPDPDHSVTAGLLRMD